MFQILVLLFTVIPAIEIYLLFSIGGQIGGANTLIVVILTGIIGASLAKSQGLSIIHKIQGDLNSGSLPANQFVHGLLVFGGGLLLLTPGFLTDILGLSMVFPGTRHVIAAFMKKWLTKAIASGNLQFSSFGSNGFAGGFSTGNRYNTENQGTYQDINSSESSTAQRQVGPDTFEAEFEKKE